MQAQLEEKGAFRHADLRIEITQLSHMIYNSGGSEKLATTRLAKRRGVHAPVNT